MQGPANQLPPSVHHHRSPLLLLKAASLFSRQVSRFPKASASALPTNQPSLCSLNCFPIFAQSELELLPPEQHPFLSLAVESLSTPFRQIERVFAPRPRARFPARFSRAFVTRPPAVRPRPACTSTTTARTRSARCAGWRCDTPRERSRRELQTLLLIRCMDVRSLCSTYS
eukprot:6214165-Pleurochrysis_carterae.AAC.3